MQLESSPPGNNASLEPDAGLERQGVAVLDGAGNWIGLTPRVVELLGPQVSALQGQPAHRSLFAAKVAACIDAAVAGDARAADSLAARLHTLLGDDDGQGWLQLQLQPLAGQSRAVLVMRQGHELSTLRQRLADLETQQQYLAYGISHDLRAALRSIEGFSRLLAQHHLAQADEIASDAAARVRAAAARAGSLVDGLLELGRADTRPREDVEVDVSMLAEWICADLADANAGRDVQVQVQPGLVARGDERQLRAMLAKLLHNAFKFSADRAQVHIAVAGRVEHDRLHLEISDQGSGFDMQYAERLFDPFRRLHAAEQGAGHGLGLAIAQRIAVQHGGRIWAHSVPGAGSTFHVLLPAASVAGMGRA